MDELQNRFSNDFDQQYNCDVTRMNSLEVALTLIYDDYSKMRIHYVQTYFMNANGAREMKMDEVLILYIVRRTDH